MTGILADINVVAQLDLLVRIWQSPSWRDVWASLALTVHSFEDLSLDTRAVDAEIWRKCQTLEIALITANRNKDGPDSLEATIRTEGTSLSLPVFTLANATRIKFNKRYAKQVAEKLLEYLLDIEKYRGSGRLYVP